MANGEQFQARDEVQQAIQTKMESFQSRLNTLKEMVAPENRPETQNQFVQKVREAQQVRLLNELVEDARRWYGIAVSYGESGSPHTALESIAAQFDEIQGIISELWSGNILLEDLIEPANTENIVLPLGINPELFDQAALHLLAEEHTEVVTDVGEGGTKPPRVVAAEATQTEEVIRPKQNRQVEKRVTRTKFFQWMIEASSRGEKPLIEEIAQALGISVKATRTHVTRLKNTLEQDPASQYALISAYADIPGSRAHRFYLIEKVASPELIDAADETQAGDPDQEKTYPFEAHISRETIDELISFVRAKLQSNKRRTTFADTPAQFYAWFPQIRMNTLADLAQLAHVQEPTSGQAWTIRIADIVSLLVANNDEETAKNIDRTTWRSLRNYVEAQTQQQQND